MRFYEQIFKALHMAYYASISNPFLRLDTADGANDASTPFLSVGRTKWKGFRRRVDEIVKAVAGTQSAMANT